MAAPSSSYFERDRPEVAALVPVGSGRVLDVGCGSGTLAQRLLAEDRASTVHGIEHHPAALVAAARVLDDLLDLDLEHTGLREVLTRRGCIYDVVIVADVLEHLRDPWRVIRDLRTTLRPGGLVVASIPNIRVASVVVPLLVRGRFEYREEGVLDRTHLRFFTRSSACALLEDAGLKIETVDRAVATWRRGWKAVVGSWLRDLGAEQFLITARQPE